jgi:predicted secreted protein
LAELDLPEQVLLTVGEERRLLLPGLGSAGYVWEVEVEGPSGVVSVSSAPAEPVERPEGAAEPVVGSVDAVVAIRGEAPGMGVVRLVQRRPWEKGTPPHREAAVRVVVT